MKGADTKILSKVLFKNEFTDNCIKNLDDFANKG